MVYKPKREQSTHTTYQSTKNNRRILATITAQTMGHLEALAKKHGWSTKDLGHTIDYLMKTYLNEHRNTGKTQEGTR